jgi:hypothetical protein
VGDGLVKGELLHETFDGYANGLLSSSPSPSSPPSSSNDEARR